VDANWESSVSGLYVAGEAAGTFGVYRPGGSALNSTQVGAMRAARHIAGKASEKVDTSKQYSPAACVNAEAKSYNRKETSAQMSRYAAYVRNPSKMEELYEALCDERKDFFVKNTVESEADLPELYKSYDILLTQIAVLSAMIYSAEHIGSRGSAIVKGADSSNGSHNDKLTITQIKGLIAVTHFEQVRPLPICDDWFETVWAKM
jgi:succinate dehydrogenase/fumarate reductase flavoprotein subunit